MAVTGGMVLMLAATHPAPAEPALYLFFTLDTPDLARVLREARAAAKIRFRPVFLLDRFSKDDLDPPESFLEAVKEAGQDLRVVDEEGLEAARRFGVRSTPCAVRTGAKTHIATGTRINWKELMSCE